MIEWNSSVCSMSLRNWMSSCRPSNLGDSFSSDTSNRCMPAYYYMRYTLYMYTLYTLLARRCTSVVWMSYASKTSHAHQQNCTRAAIRCPHVMASCKVFDLQRVASLALIFSINVSTGLPLTIARNSGRKCQPACHPLSNSCQGIKEGMC